MNAFLLFLNIWIITVYSNNIFYIFVHILSLGKLDCTMVIQKGLICRTDYCKYTLHKSCTFAIIGYIDVCMYLYALNKLLLQN